MWLFTNSFEPKMWEMNSAFSILENRRYLLLCATAAVQQQWLHLDFGFVFTQKFNCGRQSFAGHFTETRKRGKNLRNSNRSFKCFGTSCACQISQIKSKWNSEHHCQLPLMNAARNGNQVDIRQQCATLEIHSYFFFHLVWLYSHSICGLHTQPSPCTQHCGGALDRIKLNRVETTFFALVYRIKTNAEVQKMHMYEN